MINLEWHAVFRGKKWPKRIFFSKERKHKSGCKNIHKKEHNNLQFATDIIMLKVK
jgi:hypothetical protein